MDVLIVGGSKFVGRSIVERALARGHRVTTFNRGMSNPGLFEGVEEVRGDRNAELSALAGRSFDATIDCCAYFPRQVRSLLDALGSGVGHYALVSSVSVYPDDVPEGVTEDLPLAALRDDAGIDAVTDENYGPLKVGCEEVAAEALGDRCVSLRLGLVVGPWDHTGRFTTWPARLARGGEVLAPGEPSRPAQVIDARDMAAFAVHAVEARLSGPYNVVAPPRPFAAFLDEVGAGVGFSGSLTWADDAFLLERGIEPFTVLPLWLPIGQHGILAASDARARADGLETRALGDTARDTLAWLQAYPGVGDPIGIDAATEAGLLAAWHAR